MAIKNFFISITKSLIVLLLTIFIFSAVTSDFPNLLKGIFGDVFSYASPEMQKEAVGKLAESCSSLEQPNAVTMNQVCTNQTLIDSMRQSCDNYRELKKRNVQIGNEQQVSETCQQIESGEFEKQCQQLQSQSIDLSKIGSLCRDYRAGKINDQEFFMEVIGSALPAQTESMPNISALEKYNKAVNYLNSNKMLYFIILAVLLAILYLLIMDIRLFLLALCGISFSIGVLIMVPYFAVLLYDKFVGINTTSILGIMFGNATGIDPKAIASVVLLLFLRTYTGTILTLGIILLAIGIFGKVYGFVLRKKSKKKNLESEKTEKSEKPFESKEPKTKKKLKRR